MLESGANPNRRWGQSGDHFPLQEVLDTGGDLTPDPVDTVQLLLAHGADPNARWCPFESRGSYGGGPVCTTRTAMTPLIFAAAVGSREIVELLLQAGADPRPRDWGGESALDYASDEIMFEMISRAQFPDSTTRDAKALEWISDYDGGPDSRGPKATSPLIRAITLAGHGGVVFPPPPPPPETVTTESQARVSERGQRAILGRTSILLRLGVDPNQVTEGDLDWPPLTYALVDYNFRAAALLLRSGANPNGRWCAQAFTVNDNRPATRDQNCNISNGITPLMFSAAKRDRNSVALLLDFGANRSLRDWAGRMAIDYATTSEIRALLDVPRAASSQR